MPVRPSLSVLYVKPVLSVARSLGVDIDAAMAAAGIARSVLTRWDERIPADRCSTLFEHAASQLGDEHFGLHIAERLPRGAFDVVFYAIANSATLHEAFEKVICYGRILNDVGTTSFVVDPKVARLSRSFPSRKSDRFVVQGDLFLALQLIWARQATGVDLVPLAARFQHPRPSAVKEEQRLFRAALRFDHWAYELLLDPALLSLPLLRADSRLARVLDRYADEILERLPTRSQVLASVRHIISETLRGGAPTLAVIAKRMGVSGRTLQRAIAREHSSFHEEVVRVRRRLAERMLDEGDLTITETAFLLGFADVSSFNRAFRNWTGQTPSQFRASVVRGQRNRRR